MKIIETLRERERESSSLTNKKEKAITLIALVITIALNCSYLAMVVMK